tara:strand:+ start:4012 stop:4290 length:279 start_codon:yes stop_codon:yes gene_type:complete
MKILRTKLSYALYTLLACVFLSLTSCDETEQIHRTEPSVLVVTKAYQREGMNEMMYYKVELPDQTKLGYSSFIMCDSINKYKVGDVLYLNAR